MQWQAAELQEQTAVLHTQKFLPVLQPDSYKSATLLKKRIDHSTQLSFQLIRKGGGNCVQPPSDAREWEEPSDFSDNAKRQPLEVD